MSDRRASLLVADGLEKRFGGTHALRGARLVVGEREIHGLVGENGSGKSTMLRILSGQIRADRGSIELDGTRVAFADPTAALAAGVAMVTQETALVPELSVAENIFLGRRMVRRRGRIDWKATRRDARELLARLTLDLDPAVPVRRLPPDQQQLVEVARALSFRTRVLILDEPTSSLTDDEVAALFGVLRRLTQEGVSVVFVSHRLDEIFAVTDHLTVLRDGRPIGSGPIAEYDRDRIITEMVGRPPERDEATPAAATAPGQLLRVRGLSLADGRLRDVALDVGAGEIVGLAGLVGAGRSEVFEVLFGLHPDATGEASLDGAELDRRSPATAIAGGMAYVPPDRQRRGLVACMSIRENLVMSCTARRPRVRRHDRREELAIVGDAVRGFDIRAPSPDAGVDTLSGGNQQKVVLAKWLEAAPRVLMLDEPTRGVDIGAKAEIHRLLEAARGRGIGILISSSETSELLRLCDRILVMHRGRVAGALPAEQATEARIAALATGGAA